MVHVIRSNRASDEIHVTVIYSRTIVTVTSECCWWRAICKTWTGTFETLATAQTQIRRRKTQRKLRVKWNSLVPVQEHFPSLHSETIDPPVPSVLWFMKETLGSTAQSVAHLIVDPGVANSNPSSARYFHADWSWNNFFHSLPSADSRGTVVSYWLK